MVGLPVYGDLHVLYAQPTAVAEVGIWIRGQLECDDPAQNSMVSQKRGFLMQKWIDTPTVIAPTIDHHVQFSFVLPPGSPPTFQSDSANITYEVLVRVREASGAFFNWQEKVLIGLAPEPPRPQRAVLHVTSRQGPLGDKPFMELALDTADIPVNGVMTGSVSFKNLRQRKIRGVSLSLFESETTFHPYYFVQPGRLFRTRIFEGTPGEGEPIRFRVDVPKRACPTFQIPLFAVTSGIEARADVAWGEDIVLRMPVVITAPATEYQTYGMVGTGYERDVAQWEEVASSLGFVVVDPSNPNLSGASPLKMHGRRGAVTIEIGNKNRADTGPWSYATLGFPKLGIDLDVRERKWLDAIGVVSRSPVVGDRIKSGEEKIDARLIARVRDRMQAKDVITQELLAPMLAFEEVSADDTTVQLASPGSPVALDALRSFVERALVVAGAINALAARIPPPPMFTPESVLAWRALSEQLHGRLETGRMWIHEARIGIDTVEIGCEWTHRNEAKATTLYAGVMIRVVVDPPLLEAMPSSIEDPAISPHARATWQEIVKTHSGADVRIEPHALSVTLPRERFLASGAPLDPHALMPLVELAVSLRRGLAGVKAAGPFR